MCVFFRMVLQETYELEDCVVYDSLTTDNNLFTYVQGTANMEYSNNGLKYTGTATTDCIHRLTQELPDGSYTVDVDVTDINSSGYSTAIGTDDAMISGGPAGLYARKISVSGDFFSGKTFSLPFHLRIEVTGTTSKTIKYYKDSTLLGTGNSISRNKQFVLRSYSGRFIQLKNLKIKAL